MDALVDGESQLARLAQLGVFAAFGHLDDLRAFAAVVQRLIAEG